MFSVIAIVAGISEALFFSPFFMIAVGLSPILAVSAGLITQIFGMIIGLVSYFRQRLVDFRLVKIQLSGAIPGVSVGVLLAHSVSGQLLHTELCGGASGKIYPTAVSREKSLKKTEIVQTKIVLLYAWSEFMN